MPEKDLLASMEAKSLADGPTILAISLGNDDAAEALAEVAELNGAQVRSIAWMTRAIA